MKRKVSLSRLHHPARSKGQSSHQTLRESQPALSLWTFQTLLAAREFSLDPAAAWRSQPSGWLKVFRLRSNFPSGNVPMLSLACYPCHLLLLSRTESQENLKVVHLISALPAVFRSTFMWIMIWSPQIKKLLLFLQRKKKSNMSLSFLPLF